MHYDTGCKIIYSGKYVLPIIMQQYVYQQSQITVQMRETLAIIPITINSANKKYIDNNDTQVICKKMNSSNVIFDPMYNIFY